MIKTSKAMRAVCIEAKGKLVNGRVYDVEQLEDDEIFFLVSIDRQQFYFFARRFNVLPRDPLDVLDELPIG